MLKISNLVKNFKTKKAVDNVTIDVEKGDIFGFIGHNGAGKTTTLRCVAGIIDFESGSIFINGKSIKDNAIEAKFEMAYVPDNPDIYSHMKGIEYLNFISDIYKVSLLERKELIKKYAEMFEINDRLGDTIGSYSHGMRQKLVIISSLIHKPKLLILDEPFVGLDPKASFLLKNLMKEFVLQGNSIFFSTHVLEVAEKICNKIAIIKNGKVIMSGKTEEITKDKSLEGVFMDSAINAN